MKKKFQAKRDLKPLIWLVLFASVALYGRTAFASAELDRQYSLETVGALKSWDNVDGLFEQYVMEAYQGYFKEASRFRLHDLSKSDVILKRSSIPYQQIIDDKEILAQLARSMRTETLIRTKVFKEGKRYRFVLDWLHAPKIVRLATHTFYFDEPGAGREIGTEVIQGALQMALDRLIKKVPFYGHITGRDRDWITVNVGSNAYLKPGDTLIISTIEDLKTHPLLNTIVDWKVVETGRLVVDEVEDKIAFCKIIEQTPDREILRYQKVTKIIPKPMIAETPAPKEMAPETKKIQAPTLGWLMPGIWMGDFSRQFSEGGTDRDGGGWMWGFRGDGQLWLTKNFSLETGIRYGFFSYSQQDVRSGVIVNEAPANSSGSGNIVKFRLNAAYSYLITGDFFGPKGFVKLGYHSTRYTLPLSEDNNLGPTTMNALFLGVGADIPVRRKFGAYLGLDVGLIRGETVVGVTDRRPNGNTDIEFRLGGFYRFNQRMEARVGFDVMAHGVDFEGGASLTHRVIAFTPSFMYSF